MATRKMIVYGGNGFVGSHIVQKALAANWAVVVACRSGHPVNRKEPWVDQVKWVCSDALDRPGVYEVLEDHCDAEAVVSCVGHLTRNHKKAKRINGDANTNIAAAVYESKTVRKMVLVSAAPVKPGTFFLSGYYEGKRRAEKAIKEAMFERGVALKPGMIYGNRYAKGIYLPLGVVGAPLELVCRPIHSLTGWSMFTPPIHVGVVASAAVYAAGHPEVSGICDYDRMQQLALDFKKTDLKS